MSECCCCLRADWGKGEERAMGTRGGGQADNSWVGGGWAAWGWAGLAWPRPGREGHGRSQHSARIVPEVVPEVVPK